MQEEELYQWWQYYAHSGRVIKSGRRRLRVLSSGLLNTTRGPDFIAARFELDGIIYHGDVECHRKLSDWYTHNHHLDKAYRHVALHLVANSSKKSTVNSQWHRQPICTLILPKPSIVSLNPTLKCQPDHTFKKQLRSNLIRLASIWFDHKTKYFINILTERNGPALFYIHFFRALGYPGNANTFQFLAEHLNWTWIMQNRYLLGDSHQYYFAMYAGQAGFIPDKCEDEYTKCIKKIYHDYKYLLPENSLDTDLWQFAGNRSFNQVQFRLATGLQILLHYKFSLYDKIMIQLQMRQNYTTVIKSIHKMFKLPPISYWSEHYALGKQRKNLRARICIANARVAELLINVILPLAGAQALLSESEGYYNYLKDIFLNLPLTSSYNLFKKKYVSWFKSCFETRPFQSTNQSLLILQSGYCQHHLCQKCPVNRTALSRKGKMIDNKIKNI